MDAVVLGDFSGRIDIADLWKKLHIDQDHPYAARIEEMVTEAHSLARPKAQYKEAYIDSKGDNYVVIEGVKFTSRVLRVNMEETFRAFPFVVTCGIELDTWAKKFEDVFESFCADAIAELYLRSASRELESYLEQQHGLVQAVNMNPGSLADWPISEQKPLFELLGDVKGLIRVQLLSSYLLYPLKTVSGIRFPKQGSFENCQLCARKGCPSRKAPYDEGLYERQYRLRKQ